MVRGGGGGDGGGEGGLGARQGVATPVMSARPSEPASTRWTRPGGSITAAVGSGGGQASSPRVSSDPLGSWLQSDSGAERVQSELRSCVDVEVALLGSPSLISLVVSVAVKQR